MKQPISGYTHLAAVIANPIKHSLSPMIHNTAYDLLGYDAVYLAFDVSKEDFSKSMVAINAFDMLGVNISMPYKKMAYDACHQLSKEAELIGVVNTVIPKDGQLIGYNTDGVGFLRSLTEEGVSITGKSITVIGAGGAAKAIICQCALESVREINVFKRKNETYEKVKNELREITKKTTIPINLYDYNNQMSLEEIIKTSDIIINGTHIGMGDDNNLPLSDMSLIQKNHVIVDLIYHPLETPFLKEAKKSGAKTINGLGMLLYQAAYAFELMTGKKMPTKEIESILKTEINKKGEE